MAKIGFGRVVKNVLLEETTEGNRSQSPNLSQKCREISNPELDLDFPDCADPPSHI